jgi:hypothetical protein
MSRPSNNDLEYYLHRIEQECVRPGYVESPLGHHLVKGVVFDRVKARDIMDEYLVAHNEAHGIDVNRVES